MIATIRQVICEPYRTYEIIVEVVEGDESQFYRRDFTIGDSQAKFGIDDKGDPRRAMGKALEELGRSLQLGHGNPLVVRRS